MRASPPVGHIALAALLVACVAAPPPEQTTIDLPAPLPVESAEARAELPSGPGADSNEVTLPPPPRISDVRLAPPPFPFPIPSAVPGIIPPGLLPPSPTAAAAPAPTTTTQMLSKQSETRLTKDLRQALAIQAPGTTPVGPNVGGKFLAASSLQKADVLVLPIMLEPTKCYSFVAVTREKVELTLELHVDFQGVFALPIPMLPLATAKSTGPTATLGGGSSCFKMPLPMPMPTRLVVTTSDAAEVLVGVAAK